MSPVSITNHPMWPRLKSYLFVTRYDRDGGHEDPRIRIELRELPERLMHEAMFVQMACVCCGRPVNPLRRRVGDTDRLYYAPACPIGVRTSCSRSSETTLEYDRFKSEPASPSTQLSLF